MSMSYPWLDCCRLAALLPARRNRSSRDKVVSHAFLRVFLRTLFSIKLSILFSGSYFSLDIGFKGTGLSKPHI